MSCDHNLWQRPTHANRKETQSDDEAIDAFHANPRCRQDTRSRSNVNHKFLYCGHIANIGSNSSQLVLGASLADGRSKFLAEVERLSHIVTAAKSGQPILFLIDEIFSSTNSLDRRAAAEAILTQFIAHNAIGALSTHDLTLTDLAEAPTLNGLAKSPTLNGLNLHMASPDPADPLAFDYRLKPGINTSSNARAILRMMHLEP